jgi:hypothetical protein
MPRPSDRAIQRLADKESQQPAVTRLDSITLDPGKTAAKKPGGLKGNLKTIDLKRMGRRA